jgi:hypothetical protein
VAVQKYCPYGIREIEKKLKVDEFSWKLYGLKELCIIINPNNGE